VHTNVSDERSLGGAEDNVREANTDKAMITTILRGDSLTRWSFLDIFKDMYFFEVSHVTFLSRWVHFIATPINMILSMMFLSQFYLIGGHHDSIINLNVSHILIILLVASYMRLGTIRNCEVWSITVSIVLLCLSLTGRSLYIRVCGYESCSEGIYVLPLVVGFFTSLCQITSDHLYSDSTTGGEYFVIMNYNYNKQVRRKQQKNWEGDIEYRNVIGITNCNHFLLIGYNGEGGGRSVTTGFIKAEVYI
jgi:hypothetical protein